MNIYLLDDDPCDYEYLRERFSNYVGPFKLFPDSFTHFDDNSRYGNIFKYGLEAIKEFMMNEDFVGNSISIIIIDISLGDQREDELGLEIIELLKNKKISIPIYGITRYFPSKKAKDKVKNNGGKDLIYMSDFLLNDSVFEYYKNKFEEIKNVYNG